MSHAFVVLYTLVLFGLMLFVGADVMERIDLNQINALLYFLGVFLAGLVSFRSNHDGMPKSDLTSFRWVHAVRYTNYQTLVLALVLFAIIFSTKDRAISRLFVGSFLLTFWLTVTPLNRYVPDWMARLFFRGDHSVRTVFLGSEKSARRLEGWAARQPFFGVEIIGLITYELVEKSQLKMPIIGDFMELAELIEQHKIDQVVLLETRNSDWWVDSVVEVCGKAGCRILIFNPWEEYFEQELIPVNQGGHTFFSLQQEPLENPINRAIKRTLDICISLPVVLFVLPWMCLYAKIMIRRESPGPMFFKQERSGQRGRLFNIYKFRSMHHSDPSREGEQAKAEDDRVFKFGQFMRRTSIDEFPQFINVLRGQMSVVGPRPHLIQHDSQFSEQVNIYRTRHFVKPGITGLAQCKGFRGEVTELTLIEERVRYDLEYIRSWSFWLDVWILVKTALQVIFPPKSAY
ncbi:MULTISPECIES: exopolysaccharide biosynthesis polyprenyl glycosylphosphotransferase [unclassified Lentimonas]|uniref:exopolysaccharide biosynthesis polyprenyl glycosylphosphotransferase n=1 Tax=unclassified Lentimonas TaxID=2630993 RepID=UPI001389D26C|nr:MULTISPECIES: exopolysaccharide biosynthesis polyprenyl glycosylphosphotransferase [unclassified Lentimonas]